MTGAASAIAFVAAFLQVRDAITALIAASPLVVTLGASLWALVTDIQLGRLRLLIAALADDVRGREAPATCARRERGRKTLGPSTAA